MLDLDLVDRHYEAIADAPTLDGLLDALEDAALDELARAPLDGAGGGIAWALRPVCARIGQPLRPERGLAGLPAALDPDSLQRVKDWLLPTARRALLPAGTADGNGASPTWRERPLTDVVMATRPALLDRHWEGIAVHTLGTALALPLGGVGSRLLPTSTHLPPDLHRCAHEYLRTARQQLLDADAFRAGLTQGPARPADWERWEGLCERWEAEVEEHGAAGVLAAADLTATVDDATGRVGIRKGAETIGTWYPHSPPGTPALTATERPRDCVCVVLQLLRRRHGVAAQVAAAIDADPGIRLLTLLDQHLAETAAPDTAMGWVVQRGPHGAVEPCAAELDPSGRWVRRAGNIPTHDLHTTDADRRALRARELHQRTRGVDPTHRLAVHMALVGHPRVFDASGALVHLQQPTAALDLTRQGSAVQTGWRVGPTRVSSAQAAEWLSQGDGRHGLWWASAHELRLVDFRLAAPIVHVLQRAGDHIPASAVDGFLERLPGIAQRGPVEVDPALAQEERPADPTPHLRLASQADHSLSVEIVCFPAGPSGGFTAPGDGPPHRFGSQPVRFVVHRDRSAEVDAADRLIRALDLPPMHQGYRWDALPLHLAAGVVTRLSEQDIPVHWLSGVLAVHTASSGATQLRVRHKGRFFEIDGAVQTPTGSLPLRELLAQLRQGQRVIALGPSDVLALAEDLREVLVALAASTEPSEDGAVLSLAGAPLLAELEGAGVTLRMPAQVRARLEQAGSVPADQPLPEGLQATLRPYQAEGIRWLMHRRAWAPGAVLADDMGLGKTLQALGLLLHRRQEGPALVVVPTSTLPGWEREAQRFAPDLTVRRAHGASRDQALTGLGPNDVVLTTWGTLVRSIDELAAIPFDTVVLDEAQAIKNPTTRRARAVRRLHTAFLLALTGTPVENAPEELWSLFDVVAPGLLGTARAFHVEVSIPLADDLRADAGRRLRDRIRPLVLRRTKAQVLPQLPPRTDIVVPVSLSPEERRRYEAVRTAAMAAFADKKAKADRARVLAALTRLRQLASHPRLVDPHAPAVSAKLTAARATLLEVHQAGQQSLVFSQFTKLLDQLEIHLAGTGLRLGRIDGSLSIDQRQAQVDALQAGHVDVLLLSLHAAGTGLNLTAASTVLHLDSWWNPAVQDQATDRAHRIGQERAVTVLHFVAEDTVEEGIRALQAQKRKLVDTLLDGHHDAARVSGEELLALIADGGLASDVAEVRVNELLGPDHPWPVEGVPDALRDGFERWVTAAYDTRGSGALGQARAVCAMLAWGARRELPLCRGRLETLATQFAAANADSLGERAGRRAIAGVRRWLTMDLGEDA